MLGWGMHVGRKESDRLSEELAFVCFELESLKVELEGWKQVDFSKYQDRARGVWRRERLSQSVATYSERKRALVAAIQAQIS